MLFLTRTAGKPLKECIVLNPGTPDEVRIVVRAAKGNQVKIGIDAPSHTKAVREELIRE